MFCKWQYILWDRGHIVIKRTLTDDGDRMTPKRFDFSLINIYILTWASFCVYILFWNFWPKQTFITLIVISFFIKFIVISSLIMCFFHTPILMAKWKPWYLTLDFARSWLLDDILSHLAVVLEPRVGLLLKCWTRKWKQ